MSKWSHPLLDRTPHERRGRLREVAESSPSILEVVSGFVKAGHRLDM